MIAGGIQQPGMGPNAVIRKRILSRKDVSGVVQNKDFQRFHKFGWVSCLLGLIVGFPSMLHAQGLPEISNDPTKAQQNTPAPGPLPDTRDKGFELPPLPKSEQTDHYGKTIEIKKVEFAGNTVFDTAELDDLVASYLNHPIRASDLEALRLKVSQYYIDHGYINSGAVLMSQSVADGVLKLNIIEGRLTAVNQSGQGRLNESYIRDRLIIGSGTPLNIENLQNSYRRLLSDPLIQQLNGRLLPGVHPGEAVLDVVVKRNRPYQFYAGTDDYQTPAVGGYTGRIGGWTDNLLTLGERVDAQLIVNGGSLGYNTGISIPVTALDTRLSFRYSDTSSSLIEAPYNVLNLTTHILGIDAGITQPVYQTFADELVLGFNFAVRQSRTLVSDNCSIGAAFTGIVADPDCNSQVTVLRFSQRAIHRGDTNSAVLYSTFNAGINALGATTTQAGGQSGQFFSWLGQGMFSQKIWENGTMMVLKANIQLADTPLLPLERYSLGGVNTVRGYRENTYIRDNAYNANLEIKYPLYGGTSSDKNNLFLVPFVDYGGAWNNSTSVLPNQPTNYLFSSGIGFNFQYKQVNAEFYWGHAFIPSVPKQLGHNIQDDGIHFRFNINAF